MLCESAIYYKVAPAAPSDDSFSEKKFTNKTTSFDSTSSSSMIESNESASEVNHSVLSDKIAYLKKYAFTNRNTMEDEDDDDEIESDDEDDGYYDDENHPVISTSATAGVNTNSSLLSTASSSSLSQSSPSPDRANNFYNHENYTLLSSYNQRSFKQHLVDTLETTSYNQNNNLNNNHYVDYNNTIDHQNDHFQSSSYQQYYYETNGYAQQPQFIVADPQQQPEVNYESNMQQQHLYSNNYDQYQQMQAYDDEADGCYNQHYFYQQQQQQQQALNIDPSYLAQQQYYANDYVLPPASSVIMMNENVSRMEALCNEFNYNNNNNSISIDHHLQQPKQQRQQKKQNNKKQKKQNNRSCASSNNIKAEISIDYNSDMSFLKSCNSPCDSIIEDQQSRRKRKRILNKIQRQEATMREKRRMLKLNKAFEELRKVLPISEFAKNKLSRAETLKSAIEYIEKMTQILQVC